MSLSNNNEYKNSIRKHILSLRNNLEQDNAGELSRLIIKKLYNSDEYKECNRIFVYITTNNEVNTLPLIKCALKEDKKIYVPKIIEKGIIEFARINALENLIPGSFGIMEPKSDEYSYPDKNTLFVIPGVVFDKNCNRIGYGGGYYDRYLSKHEVNSNKIALAYEFQVTDNLMVNKYDIPMNKVLTQDCVYRI